MRMEQAMTIDRVIDGDAPGIGIRTGGAPRRKGLLKRALLGALGVLGLAAAAHFGMDYWQNGRFLVSTDDAYVEADNTLIAPRVSGYISQVLVTDNQPVRLGQVLARIDDQDFQTALRQAIADRETAESEIRSIDAQLVLQTSAIEQADQQVTSADAALRFAQQDHARYDLLSRTRRRHHAVGAADRVPAGPADGGPAAGARGRSPPRRQQVDVLQAARAKAAAQLEHYRAAEQQAELNLSYTTITAPVDGTVGASTLRVGQYVQAGTQLMAWCR